VVGSQPVFVTGIIKIRFPLIYYMQVMCHGPEKFRDREKFVAETGFTGGTTG